MNYTSLARLFLIRWRVVSQLEVSEAFVILVRQGVSSVDWQVVGSTLANAGRSLSMLLSQSVVFMLMQRSLGQNIFLLDWLELRERDLLERLFVSWCIEFNVVQLLLSESVVILLEYQWYQQVTNILPQVSINY